MADGGGRSSRLYSEADLARMETDRAFAAGYYWTCAMNARLKAARLRAMAMRGFVRSEDEFGPEFYDQFVETALLLARMEGERDA